METRFIDGGEYVDRQAYIEVRDENSRLRERIAELQARLDAAKQFAETVWRDSEFYALDTPFEQQWSEAVGGED